MKQERCNENCVRPDGSICHGCPRCDYVAAAASKRAATATFSVREAQETTQNGKRLCVMRNEELERLVNLGVAANLVLSTRTRRFKKGRDE